MRRSCLLLLALVLACGSAYAQTSGLDAEIRAKVGKDYWLTSTLFFCEPNLLVSNCTTLSGTRLAPKHLKIDGIETRGIIAHVDVTLICEAPRIGPHREAMVKRLADLLQVTPDRVSVKATTTERLGFTGREEGIAAQAVATVRLRG